VTLLAGTPAARAGSLVGSCDDRQSGAVGLTVAITDVSYPTASFCAAADDGRVLTSTNPAGGAGRVERREHLHRAGQLPACRAGMGRLSQDRNVNFSRELDIIAVIER
jgi:hypothetical protein